MRFPSDLVNAAQGESARRGSAKVIALVVISIAGVAGVSATVWAIQRSAKRTPTGIGSPQARVEKTQGIRFPVTIREPAGPPTVSTGIADAQGNTVMIACSTCHATRQPDPTNKASADLKEFHVKLSMAHGSIGCLSCHNPGDYDSLKLADGSRVEFTDVQRLCGQCHGPQMRDFEHNVHGGLNGYWDRTRGPQTKLNCVDCHHPHRPQFPKMRPTFKPSDRFLNSDGAAH